MVSASLFTHPTTFNPTNVAVIINKIFIIYQNTSGLLHRYLSYNAKEYSKGVDFPNK